ncbi:NisI/SpaI family lantibiotic immunity lipoprotein [Haloimpatiens sp. FM7315]|uniref:NisI/SpaI family lantibiotic immunity lipoprotein n=1 Tax=Haloimpatiens sp. FM7315 TaxID=3298609 RepID=UPI0035A39E5D
MKKIVIFVINIILISLFINFAGCSKTKQLIESASKNIKEEKTLPKYTLNEENFKEISFGGKTYSITDKSFALKDLDKPIGKVSQSFTIDENNKKLTKEELMKIYAIPSKNLEKDRINLNFGWIYSVKNLDSNNVIAVVVNQNLRRAEIIK